MSPGRRRAETWDSYCPDISRMSTTSSSVLASTTQSSSGSSPSRGSNTSDAPFSIQACPASTSSTIGCMCRRRTTGRHCAPRSNACAGSEPTSSFGRQSAFASSCGARVISAPSITGRRFISIPTTMRLDLPHSRKKPGLASSRRRRLCRLIRPVSASASSRRMVACGHRRLCSPATFISEP